MKHREYFQSRRVSWEEISSLSHRVKKVASDEVENFPISTLAWNFSDNHMFLFRPSFKRDLESKQITKKKVLTKLLDMEPFKDIPEPLKEIGRSLGPYVKSRAEVERIRRMLAAHLSSHVNSHEESNISSPLSLLDATSSVDTPQNGVRGIRKEYLRCVKANIKAQIEYNKICKEHRLHTDSDSPNLRGDNNDDSIVHDDSGVFLGSFLDTVKMGRKHERLRILQDYIDMLAQKPAATPNHFDPKVVLEDFGLLPKVPQDVMVVPGSHQNAERTDMRALVDQLEKSVLRAKLLLNKEQKFLAKIQVRDSQKVRPSVRSNKLEALGTARNDLINWIETELGKAGDSSADLDEGRDSQPQEKIGTSYVENELASIRRRYARYIKARHALIVAVTGRIDTPAATTVSKETDTAVEKEAPITTNAVNHILHPYIRELASIANEQKTIIQQKSHLTISLAKQLKEASQGLERLADESHLLPAYPILSVSAQRKGTTSFGDEIANHERPDSSHRPRAWIFASESASSVTKDGVFEKLEEGKVHALDARRGLMELYQLLGAKGNDGEHRDVENIIVKSTKKDIWGQLDGNLAVIKGDDV